MVGIKNSFADTLVQMTCANSLEIEAGGKLVDLGGTQSVCYLGFCTQIPENTSITQITPGEIVQTIPIVQTHEIDPYAGRTDISTEERLYPSYQRCFIGEVVEIGGKAELNTSNKLVPSSKITREDLGITSKDISYGTVTNWTETIFGEVCDEPGGWPLISHFVLCNSKVGIPEAYSMPDDKIIYHSPEAIWWGALNNSSPVKVEQNQVPVFKQKQFTISVSASSVTPTQGA